MKDDRGFLEDILERIALTEEFVQPGRAAFFGSRLIQEAIIRNLEIIGEACRNLSEPLRQNHPEIPRAQIIAFRNFVIHSYWGVRLERVWDIIEKELPLPKAQILLMLQSLNAPDSGESE